MSFGLSTDLCLVYFLSNTNPDEPTFFTNLKIVDKAGTRSPGYLRQNLSNDLWEFRRLLGTPETPMSLLAAASTWHQGQASSIR